VNLPERCSKQRGAVIIVVMWIALGLVSIAVYFSHSMVMELKAATNSEASVQAQFAVEGTHRYLKDMLANLTDEGQIPDYTEYPREALEIGYAVAWVVGRDPETSDHLVPYFGLIDEGSKLNLNTATADQLKLLPNMPEAFADAIIDWRDEDDEVTGSGAESNTYLSYSIPYQAKNAPFETLEELNLVHGASAELLYGEDINRNGILDPNENDGDRTPPGDDSDGVLDFGLLEYLTVYSRSPLNQTNGEPRILVTQRNEMQELLTSTFDDNRANEILSRTTGNNNSLLQWYARSGMTLQEFAQIDDAITVTTNQFTQGLVNINTASAEVIATLTGLEDGDAEAIVGWRENNPDSLTTVGWLTEVLNNNQLNQIGPLITDKSHQFTMDISAVGQNGRGYQRSLFVVDLADGTPRTIYRRDMNAEGWALGVALHREIALQMRNEQ